jgi:hypothetical protein
MRRAQAQKLDRRQAAISEQCENDFSRDLSAQAGAAGLLRVICECNAAGSLSGDIGLVSKTDAGRA